MDIKIMYVNFFFMGGNRKIWKICLLKIYKYCFVCNFNCDFLILMWCLL